MMIGTGGGEGGINITRILKIKYKYKLERDEINKFNVSDEDDGVQWFCPSGCYIKELVWQLGFSDLERKKISFIEKETGNDMREGEDRLI